MDDIPTEPPFIASLKQALIQQSANGDPKETLLFCGFVIVNALTAMHSLGLSPEEIEAFVDDLGLGVAKKHQIATAKQQLN